MNNISLSVGTIDKSSVDSAHFYAFINWNWKGRKVTNWLPVFYKFIFL